MTTPVVLINGTFVSLTSFSSRNEPTKTTAYGGARLLGIFTFLCYFFR